MARAKKKTEVQTEETKAADTAVAEYEELPAGATDFNPAEFGPQQPEGPQPDDLARRQQQAQARDAQQAAHHEGNGHHEGHHEPSPSVRDASLNGQERPRPRSTEMITDAAAKMSLHSNHANYTLVSRETPTPGEADADPGGAS
jgi:hypothetical protein